MNHVIGLNRGGKLELKKFIDHTEKIIDFQESSIKMATIGRLLLCLALPYMNLFLEDENICSLNPTPVSQFATMRFYVAAFRYGTICTKTFPRPEFSSIPKTLRTKNHGEHRLTPVNTGKRR